MKELEDIIREKYERRLKIIENGGNTERIDEELSRLVSAYKSACKEIEYYKGVAVQSAHISLIEAEINFVINQYFDRRKALKKYADELVGKLKKLKGIDKQITGIDQ